MNKYRRHGGPVPVLSPREAVMMIEDGAVVAIVGAGGGITEPTKLIDGLAERFRETGEPKNLTFGTPQASVTAATGACRRLRSWDW